MTADHSAASTIFIVDDEAALLRLVVRILEGAGHRVLSAKRGDEALKVFDEHRDEIDAVILDVNIPPEGVGGVLDRILERRSDMPVILISGDMLEVGLRDRLLACHGEFLRKPFLPRTLLSMVEEVTAGAKPGASRKEDG